uniref:Origin recognition complex subunit 4 C-terminal domain-containing protein n=1 Tax=Chenopodium quinoa TaxID=63459 RepID=A0A803LJR4_CHEQI
MEKNPAEEALMLLRRRLCDPHAFFSLLPSSSDTNFSKLKFLISSSITEACNNSVLLLGPRGCSKTAVLEVVLRDLSVEYPDMISVIKLNGLLHSDDNCALKGKQRLLYSLLDAMQSVTSQAVVIGVSCRLDADQLLEKRVRSRLSQRKLLFCPPSKDELERFLSVSTMDMKTGILSIENFKRAVVRINRQPKLEYLKDCSVLELYILVCMKRLEVKEQNSYNFNSVIKGYVAEYKAIHDSFQTPDYYARNVCLRVSMV